MVDVDSAERAYEIAGKASTAPGPGGGPSGIAKPNSDALSVAGRLVVAPTLYTPGSAPSCRVSWSNAIHRVSCSS